MSINAVVSAIQFTGKKSGKIFLQGEDRGRPSLSFEAAPVDVALLIGQQVWGGVNDLILGQTRIAKRMGYTRIRFVVAGIEDVLTRERQRKS